MTKAEVESRPGCELWGETLKEDSLSGGGITEKFAAMSHGRTRYLEAGEGEDMILLHGAGFLSGAQSWLPVIPSLAERFRVLALDCLGFGPGDGLKVPYSFAYLVDHVREFQDVLGIEKSHIVGHSMGGWIAVLFAYESPNRVRSLIDVAGGGTATRTLGSMVEWQPPAEEAIRAASASIADEAARKAFVEDRLMAAADAERTGSFRGLMDHMTNPETRLRYNTLRRMPHIKVPTLVVWGSEDKVNDPEMATTAHDLIPGSALEILQGIGHGVVQEAPVAFVGAVSQFVASLAQ